MSDRFFFDGPLGPGDVTLDGAEAHHLSAVRRFAAGDAVTLFNGDGHEYPGVIVNVGKKRVKASKDFTVAGRHTLTLKLSKAVRRLLRHRRTVTLTLAVTDDAGNGTTLKRTLKLRAR